VELIAARLLLAQDSVRIQHRRAACRQPRRNGNHAEKHERHDSEGQGSVAF
jgi:hypothetical protein